MELPRIKHLPDRIKAKALEQQRFHKNIQDENDLLFTAFDWDKSFDGKKYWTNISNIIFKQINNESKTG